MDAPWLEAIVLCLTADGIRHLFPHGRETVGVTWEPPLDPTESIVDAIADLGLAPTMAHSTSWRIEDRRLVLTFLVVVDAPADLPPTYDAELVARVELARGHATGPPAAVHLSQVVEHGLRHLAWLVREDDAIADAMPGWLGALAAYAPEPFRAFQHDPGPAGLRP
jgi:hypothetical protein